jgi:hypothetical protein
VAQGVGPEFKPQYHKKKRKKPKGKLPQILGLSDKHLNQGEAVKKGQNEPTKKSGL